MGPARHRIVRIAALATVDTRPWLIAALGAGILAIVLGMSGANYLCGG